MTLQPDQSDYRCPEGHRWRDLSEIVPLATIKCPHCGRTATIESAHRHGKLVHTWPVQPVRHLEADVKA